MDRVQDKLNLEAHVWTLSAIYKNCKDRSIKNANYSNAASGNATDEEIKQFTNCVTKNLKAVALFPSIIN